LVCSSWNFVRLEKVAIAPGPPGATDYSTWISRIKEHACRARPTSAGAQSIEALSIIKALTKRGYDGVLDHGVHGEGACFGYGGCAKRHESRRAKALQIPSLEASRLLLLGKEGIGYAAARLGQSKKCVAPCA
jgi:hypothetical protein